MEANFPENLIKQFEDNIFLHFVVTLTRLGLPTFGKRMTRRRCGPGGACAAAAPALRLSAGRSTLGAWTPRKPWSGSASGQVLHLWRARTLVCNARHYA